MLIPAARFISRLSIKQKLRLMIVLACTIVLTLAATLFVALWLAWFRSQVQMELGIPAQNIAYQSEAPLDFGEVQNCQEILATLKANPNILLGGLYKSEGSTNRLMARYTRAGEKTPLELPPNLPPDGFAARTLELVTPVQSSTEKDRRLGTLYLRLDERVEERFIYKALVRTAQLLGFSIVVAWFLADLFQGAMTRPLLKFLHTIQRVTEHNDFTLRASKTSEDELGQLVDGFNKMLGQLQQRDAALSRYQEQLEEQVAQRTAELSQANQELQATTQKAEEARRAADAANEAKSLFLASMSHEIRTPLNAVLGYAQILRRDPSLPSKHLPAITTIERSGDHLLSMINDILDLSKIEAGRMEVIKTDFDLVMLLEALHSMFVARCQDRQIAFSVDYAGLGNMPATLPVRGDEGKLRQVLINLLGNAIKFIEQGQIRLVMNLLPEELESESSRIDAPSRRFRFEVIDTGPGISPDTLQKLFQPFQQGEEGRRKGGTGLGLVISQRQLGLLGSRLEVESQRGKGSRFYFEIRMEVARSGTETSTRNRRVRGENARIAGNRRIRALVVDDVTENREVLSQMLQSVGCSVRVAESGPSGIQALRDEMCDIVFLDIRMPGMDGPVALKQMHAEHGRGRFKVVAASASAMTHEREGYLEAGFDVFMGKPFKFEELCDHLETLLQIQIESESAAPATAAVADAAEDPEISEAIWQELKTAADQYSGTRVNRALRKLEAVGPAEQALAEKLNLLAEEGNLEAVSRYLDQVRHS